MYKKSKLLALALGIVAVSSVVVAGTALGSMPVRATDGGHESIDAAVGSSGSPGYISGQVVDDENNAISGASVTVEDDSGTVVASTSTSASGEYTVEVAPGEYTVVAQNDGTEGRTSVTVESGFTTSADIVLVTASPGYVSGTVTNAGSDPVSGASVTVENETGSVVASASTSASGEYTVEVAPGEYTVFAEGDGTEGRTSVTVESDQTTGADIVVRPVTESGSITGAVVDEENNAISGASVTVENDSGSVVASASTSASGEYTVEVAPGEYTVYAESDGTVGQNSVTVYSAKTTTADFVLDVPDRPGTIIGTVFDGENDSISGAVVSVKDTSGLVVAETTTDAEGDYTVLIAPGEYTVVAESDGNTDQTVAVSVESERTTEANFVVSSGSDPGENESPAASITWTTADPVPGQEVTFDASASADSDGEIASYTWDFDGDGQADVQTSSPTATHTYSEAGTYTAVVTVTDDDGATDTASETATVEGGDSSAERHLESTQIAPGGETTVTVEATAQSNDLTVSESFSPEVAAASIESVTVDGESRSPVVEVADPTGALVAVGGVNPGQTVVTEYTVEAGENADPGTTYSVSGSVTSDSEVSLGSDDIVVVEGSPLDGVSGEYDADNDGEIDLGELSQAATQYASGALTLAELSEVATAYAS